MKLHISASSDDVIHDIADFTLQLARDIVAKKKRFTWALSGGSSPKRLFELLASSPYAERFPWEHTFFFFGDERYVPHDSDDSNFKMANDAMLSPMKVHPEHIFAVDTSLSPPEAAENYEKDIAIYFDTHMPVLDLVMLGLGDDAHTASLFPGTNVLDEKDKLVSEVYLHDKDVFRITFTKTLINNADTVAFLTFGEKKAPAVQQVMEGPRNPEKYPAQLIAPASNNVHWFIDKQAAAELKD